MFLFLFLIQGLLAQDLVPEKVKLTFEEGLLFRKDNDILMRMRFRVQNRFTAEADGEDVGKLTRTEFSVRRTRLRFDGHAFDPRLLYRLQLSFTRGDQDWDNAKVPNILRDAAVGWRWNPNHTLWFGIAKLPGNRQRVVSSSAQQLVDRSIVNATFTVDRDMGVQHFSRFGDERPVWLKLALSNGEGRNQPNKNASLSTTARLEWFPLGNFHDDGDTVDADLYREPEPRLNIGVALNANQLSARTGGQTGVDMGPNEFRSMETRFVDMVFKYRGTSVSMEYAKRTAGNPLVSPGIFVYSGEGFNVQTGHVFENNWEPSLRYSMVRPEQEIRGEAQELKQYTVGLSRYIQNHVVKIQTDLTHQDAFATATMPAGQQWIWRVQLEIGI